MGRVLHNWDLATKRTLLSKAYAALPSGGALIVYERLIDDERRTGSAGLLASLEPSAVAGASPVGLLGVAGRYWHSHHRPRAAAPPAHAPWNRVLASLVPSRLERAKTKQGAQAQC